MATADYGAVPLLDVRAAPGQSVMRALRGATDVDTAYGGGFVSGMLGRRSDLEGTRDWFFFVDGVSASVGAEQVELSAGDTVWWDYRDWGSSWTRRPSWGSGRPRSLARAAGPRRRCSRSRRSPRRSRRGAELTTGASPGG